MSPILSLLYQRRRYIVASSTVKSDSCCIGSCLHFKLAKSAIFQFSISHSGFLLRCSSSFIHIMCIDCSGIKFMFNSSCKKFKSSLTLSLLKPWISYSMWVSSCEPLPAISVCIGCVRKMI